MSEPNLKARALRDYPDLVEPILITPCSTCESHPTVGPGGKWDAVRCVTDGRGRLIEYGLLKETNDWVVWSD